MGKKSKKRVKQKPNRLFIVNFSIIVVLFGAIIYWFISFSTPSLPQPPLKQLAQNHNISLGVHAYLNRLSDKPETSIITSQYSFLTIDGEVNWTIAHPTATTYNFSEADKMISFAKANNMPVQIHHLIWGEQVYLPNWLKNGNYSSSQLLSIMHNDINTVMGHFKGEVGVWSVANEVFSREQHVNNLSDWWADHIGGGTTYVDDAFIWAHQIDPNAKLILNDFENQSEDSISNAQFNYIVAAKARGIPIDGIGMQMHINAADPPNVQAMIQNMRRFGSIGVPTYITEFDVNMNYVKGSPVYKSQLEAQITYNVARACIESKTCISFSNFGISDKESLAKWLFDTDSHSYLFNSRYQPKPSFYAFREAWVQP